MLSHRAYWKECGEKNTEVAFRRSFKAGYGVETDIRDFNGQLVISHDIPTGDEMTFEQFLTIFSEYDKSLPLAINIKSDGLQDLLKSLLDKYSIHNYFVFDMSVPDGLQYVQKDFKVFTRLSEYEKVPSFYEESQGVWLDCFNEDWIDESVINYHLNNGKKVCIVSPELHGRDSINGWKNYGKSFINNNNVMLCTDYIEKANNYFGLECKYVR
ncbi:MAG: hypothetical protein PHC34_06170 [Candidatus Gastranaerophilales bacterium]|nr:hypothetical protein [Candidatus Gastranaerophilales bacterium]